MTFDVETNDRARSVLQALQKIFKTTIVEASLINYGPMSAVEIRLCDETELTARITQDICTLRGTENLRDAQAVRVEADLATVLNGFPVVTTDLLRELSHERDSFVTKRRPLKFLPCPPPTFDQD